MAITLAERHLLLRSIDDLAHYRVLGFPQAAHYLGERYYAMAQRNPNYSEPPNQLDLNRLLCHNSADVVVADRRIYHWMDRQLQQVYNERPRPVEEDALFMRVPIGSFSALPPCVMPSMPACAPYRKTASTPKS